jgi:multidrug efflux system outer membrane protein
MVSPHEYAGMIHFRILCLTTTLACAACTVGPNFKLPEVLMPSKWKNASKQNTADIPVPDEWWKLFNSAELNQLEARALENNQDLRGALARVETARALVGVQQADWFPQLDMKDAMQYERLSQSAFGANLPAGVTLPKLQRRRFQNLIGLNWEFDFWGRVRRNVESSKASQFAEMETLSAKRLTIAAEVARLYFLAHSLDRQMQVVIGTRTWREEALKLQESRFKGGLANETDVARARTELELSHNDLAALEGQRGHAENALAVICGEIPSNFRIAKSAGLPKLPKVPGGLPSTLLQRRPDIRAAEQRMREANAQVGVSAASFYPAFSIVGSGGLESIGARNFYDQRSRVLSIGPSVTLPMFHGGRLRANMRSSKAAYEQTLASYRQAILVALQEVEDSMVDAKAYGKQSAFLDAAIAAAQETQRLAELRYQKGLASFFEVVDANRTVLSAKLLSAQVEGQRLIASVAMLKALGGGWQ